MSKTGKIVIWAVVAAVLTGILIWGLAGKASFGAVWGNFADTVKNLKVDDFVDRLPDDAQTVSYTHLDVYKRQVQYCVVNPVRS